MYAQLVYCCFFFFSQRKLAKSSSLKMMAQDMLTADEDEADSREIHAHLNGVVMNLI